jgi:hypothetical protein
MISDELKTVILNVLKLDDWKLPRLHWRGKFRVGTHSVM